MPSSPKVVTVSGGAGQIAYSLLFRIGAGELFGPDQSLILKILEVSQAKRALTGILMELHDCAFPLLKEIHISTDPYEAFEGVDVALLIGAKPRGEGMERRDLLKENAKIFIEQGTVLNEKAADNAIVFVVGNPCNTNALIVLHKAPKIDPQRIFSMTRLDENRAKAQLAMKTNLAVDQVRKVAIWGNHSATQVPDFTHAEIGGVLAENLIGDRAWLEGHFIPVVQKRGGAVIEMRGKSSAASAASAAIDSIRSLFSPRTGEDWFSVGLCSDGNPYGIQEGLIFSFPCRSHGDGRVEIVSDLHWDPFIREKIALTEKELMQEWEEVKDLI